MPYTLSSHIILRLPSCSFFFFFTDTTSTEIYTLSLHDALPISLVRGAAVEGPGHEIVFADHAMQVGQKLRAAGVEIIGDRKSTRLNSSHTVISYAVFCLKKKKTDDSGFATRYLFRRISGVDVYR